MGGFSSFVIPGIVFVFTLSTGFWLSRSARPFSTILIAIHKLIALGAVVTAGVQFTIMLKLSVPALPIALLVVAILCVLGLFASGALLSQPKSASTFVLRIHQAASPLLLASSIASIWLWIGSK